MNRCHACAVAGLAACAHLAVLGVIEAAHPRREEARPALTVDALPESDHAHRDYDRGVRTLAVNFADVSSGSTIPTILRAPRPAEWAEAEATSRFLGSNGSALPIILRATRPV